MKGAMRSAAVLLALLLALPVPAQTAAARPVAKPDRSKPPALGPVRALKLPPVQRLRLSNGVPVLLMGLCLNAKDNDGK